MQGVEQKAKASLGGWTWGSSVNLREPAATGCVSRHRTALSRACIRAAPGLLRCEGHWHGDLKVPRRRALSQPIGLVANHATPAQAVVAAEEKGPGVVTAWSGWTHLHNPRQHVVQHVKKRKKKKKKEREQTNKQNAASKTIPLLYLSTSRLFFPAVLMGLGCCLTPLMAAARFCLFAADPRPSQRSTLCTGSMHRRSGPYRIPHRPGSARPVSCLQYFLFFSFFSLPSVANKQLQFPSFSLFCQC